MAFVWRDILSVSPNWHLIPRRDNYSDCADSDRVMGVL
jgi:hypothetical protein